MRIRPRASIGRYIAGCERLALGRLHRIASAGEPVAIRPINGIHDSIREVQALVGYRFNRVIHMLGGEDCAANRLDDGNRQPDHVRQRQRKDHRHDMRERGRRREADDWRPGQGDACWITSGFVQKRRQRLDKDESDQQT